MADTIRPEAAKIIKRLREMNTNAVLLTGDNLRAAEYLASKVGITEIRADLLPEEKMKNITLLKGNGKICMIGSLVHNAGSCFVVLLAALLYDRKYEYS